MNIFPNIIAVRIISTYQDDMKNTCHIIAPTLENDPSRYEIVIYRDRDNIVPVLFSKEDCPHHHYWSREDASPEPFIRDMAERIAELLGI